MADTQNADKVTLDQIRALIAEEVQLIVSNECVCRFEETPAPITNHIEDEEKAATETIALLEMIHEDVCTHPEDHDT